MRTLAVPAGAPFVTWDLRDAMGLPLEGGMYFAVARTEGRRVSTPVLVVR
jgi:hypothetical protein